MKLNILKSIKNKLKPTMAKSKKTTKPKKAKKNTKPKMTDEQKRKFIADKFEDCAAVYGFSTNEDVSEALQERAEGKKAGMAKDLAEIIYMSGIVQIPEGMKPGFEEFWAEKVKEIQ